MLAGTTSSSIEGNHNSATCPRENAIQLVQWLSDKFHRTKGGGDETRVYLSNAGTFCICGAHLIPLYFLHKHTHLLLPTLSTLLNRVQQLWQDSCHNDNRSIPLHYYNKGRQTPTVYIRLLCEVCANWCLTPTLPILRSAMVCISLDYPTHSDRTSQESLAFQSKIASHRTHSKSKIEHCFGIVGLCAIIARSQGSSFSPSACRPCTKLHQALCFSESLSCNVELYVTVDFRQNHKAKAFRRKALYKSLHNPGFSLKARHRQ